MYRWKKRGRLYSSDGNFYRKFGLDWQISLPHKAHFLLGKEQPTMTRLTWCLCPAELLFSAFGSNHRSVLLWFAPNSAFLPQTCVVPGLIPGTLLLWPLSSYSYKNLRAIGLFLPNIFWQVTGELNTDKKFENNKVLFLTSEACSLY